jgi:hypothetical protein
MRKITMLLTVLMLVGVLAAGVQAQPQEKSPAAEGWPMGRMYDPKTVTTLEGTIESIDKVTAGRMDLPARILVKMKTAQETVTIYLGPEWYLEKQEAKLFPGDPIKVRGSKIAFENQAVILPNEITKGNKVLKFWDDQGMPAWRGQGPGAKKQ